MPGDPDMPLCSRRAWRGGALRRVPHRVGLGCQSARKVQFVLKSRYQSTNATNARDCIGVRASNGSGVSSVMPVVTVRRQVPITRPAEMIVGRTMSLVPGTICLTCSGASEKILVETRQSHNLRLGNCR